MKFYIQVFRPEARGIPGNRIARPAGIAAETAGNLYLTTKFLNMLRRAETRG